MNTTPPPHIYIRDGLSQGITHEVLQAALANSKAIERHGVFPILTLGHLAHLADVNPNFLREVVQRSYNPYHTFEIAKRGSSDSKRKISVPESRLMTVQRWILRNVLNRTGRHEASFAFEVGESIRSCAQLHCGARWLIKLDIHNFFHSVNERQVYEVFRSFGYQPLMAFELSRICTRAVGINARRSNIDPDRYSISDYHSPMLGFLPQGAPTSGKLANLAARSLDEQFVALSRSTNTLYSRYADDIVLSSADAFRRSFAVDLLHKANAIVRANGFQPHNRKSQIVTPGARKIVLGLLVDLDTPRIPQYTRRRILSHVRGTEKFGVANHRKSRQFSSTWGFIAHVWGLLSFAQDIEPAWARPLRTRWERVLQRDGWELEFRPDLFVADSIGANRGPDPLLDSH